MMFVVARLPSSPNAPFDETFLPAIRRVAEFIPGDAPQAVRVVSLNPKQVARSYVLEGESSGSVVAAYPVFQIRFARDWIMVDAALDREFFPDSTSFSDAHYDEIQVALRDARLVVITHEHHDHIAGILRSPYFAQMQAHTLLTRAQVQSLIERPNDPRIKIDAEFADRFVVFDYDPLVPIARGVVLIKAAGHTPGSQMVYVRLASNQEIILAGDVAWNMEGIETQRHKPKASTQSFGGEDRDAIARQLRWLRDVSGPQTAVVVSHDEASIRALVAAGILVEGFDVTAP
jgi:glyoxylase-like metal-dependent hydrolase (beta-lactamase superfamily II)